MELTKPSAEFCAEWSLRHIDVQPTASKDAGVLTWYVSAKLLYTGYIKAASRARVEGLDQAEFWSVLRILFSPSISTGKRSSVPVYIGIRFYRDKNKQELVYGC